MVIIQVGTVSKSSDGYPNTKQSSEINNKQRLNKIIYINRWYWDEGLGQNDLFNNWIWNVDMMWEIEHVLGLLAACQCRGGWRPASLHSSPWPSSWTSPWSSPLRGRLLEEIKARYVLCCLQGCCVLHFLSLTFSSTVAHLVLASSVAGNLTNLFELGCEVESPSGWKKLKVLIVESSLYLALLPL